MRSIVQDAIQNEFRMSESPEIVSSFQRRLSAFFEFVLDGQSYFLKVRKPRSQSSIDPGTAAQDPELQAAAKREWKSLTYLNEKTSAPECPLNTVPPVTYISSINGFVTRKVNGNDLWRMVREPRFGPSERNLELFYTIGRGLGYLVDATKNGSGAIPTTVASVGRPSLDQSIRNVLQRYSEFPIDKSLIMRTFDIRDIVVDHGGRIYLMDPGDLREVFQYEPAAGFLATLRNLNRGTPGIPTYRTINHYEQAFVRGFSEAFPCSYELLLLFLIVRLAGSYERVLRRVDRTRLPAFVKPPLRHLWLQRSYHREIQALLNQLS